MSHKYSLKYIKHMYISASMLSKQSIYSMLNSITHEKLQWALCLKYVLDV